MDDAINDATSHWIDRHTDFSFEELSKSFPWMNEGLAREEIAFWQEHGFIVSFNGRFKGTDRQTNSKLVFLDIDGVLNHSKSRDAIDSRCLANLARVIKETDAIIILISSWKAGWSKDEKERQDDDADYLDRRLAEIGLVITDKSSGFVGSRTISIVDWVMRYNADSWVELDDDYLQYKRFFPESRYVKTDYYQGGLTGDLADEAIAKLNVIKPIPETGF